MWGGGGEVQKKKYSRKGKLNEKNSCTPINTKKIFMLWPKKNSCKEFDNEKKIPAARKFPSPPPHNFSNSPSLILSFLGRGAGDGQVGCEGVTLFLGEYKGASFVFVNPKKTSLMKKN